MGQLCRGAQAERVAAPHDVATPTTAVTAWPTRSSCWGTDRLARLGRLAGLGRPGDGHHQRQRARPRLRGRSVLQYTGDTVGPAAGEYRSNHVTTVWVCGIGLLEAEPMFFAEQYEEIPDQDDHGGCGCRRSMTWTSTVAVILYEHVQRPPHQRRPAQPSPWPMTPKSAPRSRHRGAAAARPGSCSSRIQNHQACPDRLLDATGGQAPGR